MQFNVTAIVDGEVQKQIREAILGEFRTMVRNEIEQAILTEIKRIVPTLMAKFDTQGWAFRRIVQEVLQQSVTWDSAIGAKIQKEVDTVTKDLTQKALKKAIQTGVEAEIEGKLKNKTVWEAKAQETYVRTIVRQELKAMLAGIKGA